MIRRSFLKGIAGFLGLAPVVMPEDSSPIPSHYFDWTGESFGLPRGPWCRNAFTTDPRYKDTLDYGGTQKVLCDGVDAGPYVRRCQTGEQGWGEILAHDADGKPLMDWDKFEPAVRILRGRVEYVP